MKQIFSKLQILTFIILLTSCAANYRQISPSTLNYPANGLESGVKISTKYDVLRFRGNKKYANKELRKGIKVVAVEITNLTDSILMVGRDLEFYAGQQPLVLIDPNVVASTIKQSTIGYLPYLLLTFVQLNYTVTTPTETNAGTIPIGYALGPGITIGNILTATKANRQLKNELNDYDIMNRNIQKGEKIYGIIGFRSVDYLPISAKIRK